MRKQPKQFNASSYDIKSIAKTAFKGAIKGAIYVELLTVVGCFYFYRKTNRDPEFRYKLYTNPFGYGILRSYYTVGEILNSELKIKEQDLALWKQQGKPV